MEEFGPNDLYYGQVLLDIAYLEFNLRNFGEAEALLNQSLEIHEAELGPDDPGLIGVLLGLGDVYQAQGRYVEATPLLDRAVASRKVRNSHERPTCSQASFGLDR